MSDISENKTKHSEWNYHPDVPIGNNPLFEFPWSISKIITYHRDYWLTISEVSFFLLLSAFVWFTHQAYISNGVDSSFWWMGQIYLRNFVITVIVAGGLHHFLYRRKSQNTETKYIAAFLHRGGSKFTFGNQIFDNMFYSLFSGVLIWSIYEAFLLWALASGQNRSLTLGSEPFLFIFLLLFTGVWVAFHFYLIHRLLHWGILYDLVHSLHHRNVNVGPWSGISMHPVEHALYFSSMLIHLVLPSHPIHIIFHGYMLALSAIIGHAGFHELLVGKSRRIALGHFHHQLHHRYFECNYGSVDFPMDVWFGTFHDGTVNATSRLKNRFRKK